MRKHKYAGKVSAFLLALVLLTACLPFGTTAQDQQAVYTGDVLAVINTNRRNTFADFTTDRTETVEAAEETAEPEAGGNRMLKDAPLEEPEPLSGAQALLRQAQVGDVEPQAAAEYRVGDKKTIYSHYAVSEGRSFRRVDMVCTVVSEMTTVWRESGTEADYTAYDADLAADMDRLLPIELEFFGDRRIDTDGDGKIAIFLYTIDGVNIGGYFTVTDLMDRVGRIGSVWHPYFSTSNHMDCIHAQGRNSYSFNVETCLHEYQHYIEASYRFVGRNNFNCLDATETFINEGFSTGAEFLLLDDYDYFYGLTNATKPSSELSFLHWKHDNGNYSLAFLFSQYIRTRYAALTNDLDSNIPGGSIYRTILESRTPKNDDDTMALIADLLYPEAAYPQLRDSEARCGQLLCDYWLAVYCQDKEGVHGFNGEKWLNRIDRQALLTEMPAGRTEYPIRSGMAGFYRIAENDADTVCITQSDASLTFVVPPKQGFVLRFDANGGTAAPQAQILTDGYRFERQSRDVGPYRSGYTFMGWALTPDASSAQYNFGDRITVTEDTTLYAVWETSPTVVTDTTYAIRKQGREDCNNYRFVPETDGIYKLVYNVSDSNVSDSKTFFSLLMDVYANGERVDPVYTRLSRSSASDYYQLTGGTVYDLRLQSYLGFSDAWTFWIVRQDTYYTLTYRSMHGIGDAEWSCVGDTVYTVDDIGSGSIPKFMGWAYTAGAQTPDVMPGDKVTLTQDTTLYAVFKPETPLPTDGSIVRDAMEYGKFLFVLRPEQDGMYTIEWQRDGAPENEYSYAYADFLDARGSSLADAEPQTSLTVALRGGETYYLYGKTDAPNAAATCRKVSDRITTSLTFSVGEIAWFDLTLHNKAVYTIPNYTPVALNGRKFLGWEDENTWNSYAPGDTIVIAADTVLTAQWSDASDVTTTDLLLMPLRVIRALCQNLFLRIADRVTR